MEYFINEDNINMVLEIIKNVAFALLIFLIGKIIANKLIFSLRKILKKKGVDETLVSFSCNVAYGLAVAFLAITSLSFLGVQTASLTAVLAAGGLAIGIAFQGSLSNIASGVMIILFKPFAIGHFIEAAGILGTIEEVGIFHTRLRTPDNKTIILPNSKIISDEIINYSMKENRRIDMIFGCSYDDDLKKVKEVIEKVLADEPRVLKDPAPVVGVLELADSSVNFTVRPWVQRDDYFTTMLDLNEKMKLAFDEAGISIPYPQRDVHIKKEL